MKTTIIKGREFKSRRSRLQITRRNHIKIAKLEMGDALIIFRDQGGKRIRKYGDGEWDVIHVNKHSVTLQNWPTYERIRLKYGK